MYDVIFVYQRDPVKDQIKSCMYTKSVDEIIKRHNIKYHLKPSNKWDDISPSDEACIANMNIWTIIRQNSLALFFHSSNI